jgi:superfamily II DNA/RNA helicase
MNVNVPKKVLNRKLKKRRREESAATTNDEEPEIKALKEASPEPEECDNGDAQPKAVPVKSSILTDMKFDVLKGKVADRTLGKLGRMGFQFMTEIQSRAIEPLLEVRLV